MYMLPVMEDCCDQVFCITLFSYLLFQLCRESIVSSFEKGKCLFSSFLRSHFKCLFSVCNATNSPFILVRAGQFLILEFSLRTRQTLIHCVVSFEPFHLLSSISGYQRMIIRCFFFVTYQVRTSDMTDAWLLFNLNCFGFWIDPLLCNKLRMTKLFFFFFFFCGIFGRP